MTRKTSLFSNSEVPVSWGVCFIISICFHLALLGGILFFPNMHFNRKINHSVINVDLVSAPVQEKRSRVETPGVAKRTAPAVSKPAEPAPAKKKTEVKRRKHAAHKKQLDKTTPVSAKPEKKKTAEKKPGMATSDSSKKTKKSVPPPPPDKAEDAGRPESVLNAINKLKKELDVKEDGGRSSGSSAAASSGAGARRVNELRNIYIVEIAYQIQKNWAFNAQLSGDGGRLETFVVFKVLPDGRIKDVWFEKRSGNTYLDESAYRAIMKSNPVMPHPKGIKEPFVTVALRFTPAGLK